MMICGLTSRKSSFNHSLKSKGAKSALADSPLIETIYFPIAPHSNLPLHLRLKNQTPQIREDQCS